MKRISTLVLVGFLAFLPCRASANWQEYQENNLDTILSGLKPDKAGNTYLPVAKYLVKATCTEKTRKMSVSTKDFLVAYLNAYHYPASGADMYEDEMLFTKGSHLYWMPIQKPLLSHLKQEVHAGEEVNLYIYRTAAEKDRWILLVNQFTKGSDRLP